MAIVMNANTVAPGHVGNYPGDDEAKVRGLKYVVTGDCDSSAINVARSTEESGFLCLL